MLSCSVLADSPPIGLPANEVSQARDPATIELNAEQLTSGRKHHFFGYIGQCRTVPWSADGRFILGLEIDRIDRMPKPEEAATVILIDTHDENKILRVDETNAWNPQQGTMFYWNPQAPDTQFFFNDRDVETGEVFTVIYDLEEKKRLLVSCRQLEGLLKEREPDLVHRGLFIIRVVAEGP